MDRSLLFASGYEHCIYFTARAAPPSVSLDGSLCQHGSDITLSDDVASGSIMHVRVLAQRVVVWRRSSIS
eukprot:COSAG06_NODE_32040_length_512_cov_0.905569_1_plen_69_part_01